MVGRCYTSMVPSVFSLLVQAIARDRGTQDKKAVTALACNLSGRDLGDGLEMPDFTGNSVIPQSSRTI